MAGDFGKPNATGRSSGKLTGRDAKLMRPPEGEPFVWLTRELVASDAWQARSRHCARLIDFLLIEHMNHAATENGNLKATYEQLVQFGFSRRKIVGAIEEAERLGLVRCQRGGKRRPSTYRLTFYSDRDRSPPTNEWKNYQRKFESSVPPCGTKQVPPCGTKNTPYGATKGNHTSVPPCGTPSISSMGTTNGTDPDQALVERVARLNGVQNLKMAPAAIVSALNPTTRKRLLVDLKADRLTDGDLTREAVTAAKANRDKRRATRLVGSKPLMPVTL